MASVRALEGGTSAAIHAVGLADGTRLVLRRLVLADWLVREPDLAAREADALRFLAATPVPAPQLVAVDPHGAECDVPALLMTRLPGRVRIDEPVDVAAMAEALHAVRAVTPAGIPATRRYQPYNLGEPLAPPSWSARTSLWERAIEHYQAGPPPGPQSFIHRDFHAGNVLWQRGSLTGVLDWIECCMGPRGVDAGHARQNFATRLGPDAADAFLVALGEEHDPWFDLASAVDAIEHGPQDGAVERFEDFLARAVAALG